MNKQFAIKNGDTLPPIEIQALDQSGNPFNLTGHTAKIVVAARPGDRPIVNAAAVIVNPVEGRIQYDWKEGDTSKPGDYLLEIILVNATGKQTTIPGAGYGKVTITPRL